VKDLLEEGSVLHCEIGAYITVCYARHVTSRHVTIDQEAGGTGGGLGGGRWGDGNRISRRARLGFPVAS